MSIWLTIRSFIAFYFLFFGLAWMAGAPEPRVFLGAFFRRTRVNLLLGVWVAMRARR